MDALGGLVENEEFRIREERAADGELLLLTAGEHAAFAGQHFLQDGKQTVDAFEASVVGGPAATVDEETYVEIFFDGEVREDVAALRDVGDPGAGADVGGEGGDVLAGEGEGAAAHGQEAGDGAERGGLAYAVATHEGDDFAGVHGEVDAAEDAGAGDVGFDGGELEEGAHSEGTTEEQRH